MATTNPASFPLSVPPARKSYRDPGELLFGFSVIMVVLWVPGPAQLILGAIALLATFTLVLLRRQSWDELGLGRRGLVASLWILPAAAALAVASVLVAKSAGTLHPLENADFVHVGGYVLWTVYQQFLLQDYFMPRLTRVVSSDPGIAIAAVLFAVAHWPNLWLALAALIWGAVSCLLFRRYRNLYVLGLAQGLLGLCFAVCLPDTLHHELRVGLEYWRYPPRP